METHHKRTLNGQRGFAYFYWGNYRETAKEVKAKDPKSEAKEVTDALFLLWKSLTKKEQQEWTDSVPADDPFLVADDPSTAVEPDINTGQESMSHEAMCSLIRMSEGQYKTIERLKAKNKELKAENDDLKKQIACFKFETTFVRR
jgi:hypothetical protein